MRVKRPEQKPQEVVPTPSTTAKALGIGVAALAAVPAANAATFTVTTLADGGAGSLRQAIEDANGNAGADVINFQAGLTGTITLTTGQLEVTDSVDIQGPGASTITVSGNDASRVFYLYIGSATIDVTISDLTISNGADSIGAGIVDFDENLTLDSVVITNNHSSGDGGGLWADGFNMTLTIQNTTISGNTSGDDGGGIYVEDTGGPLLIENSIISGNEASDQGGGIYFYDPDSPVTIRDTTISGNTAATVGGGVYLYSPDDGLFTIEGSTISGNSAPAGGGVFLYSADHGLQVTNTTVSGNAATTGSGGGIYLYNLYGGSSFDFVTVANNTAVGVGGGIFVNASTLTIANSIVGGNTASSDADLANYIDGDFDVSYSLVQAPGSANINDVAGNIFNDDPELGALADNGGPTETMRPALTSPVINAADPAFAPPPATDQRGENRLVGGRADMGALEINGGTIQFNPAVYNVNEGNTNLNITVTRDVGPDPATVNYTTNDISATAGSDYTTAAGTLNFAAGDLSETIVVPILDDNVAEANETFTATLNTPSIGSTIGAANTATVTIADAPAGTIQFSLATATTPEETSPAMLTVTRIGGTEGPLSANYTSADGTATAGADYTAVAGTITFPAGDATPQVINIPILDDVLVEPDETFTVTLSGAAVAAPSTATVTITNIDAAPAVPVPALGLFGKLFLGIMTTAAAMWALMRRGASLFLIGMLFAAVVAAPPASAANGNAQKKHDASKLQETKDEQKLRGTIQSVANNDNGQVTLTFTDNRTVTLRTKDAHVSDARGEAPKPAALTDVTAGRNVVVKMKKNGKVRIKIVK